MTLEDIIISTSLSILSIVHIIVATRLCAVCAGIRTYFETRIKLEGEVLVYTPRPSHYTYMCMLNRKMAVNGLQMGMATFISKVVVWG